MPQQKLFEIDPDNFGFNVRLVKEYRHPTFDDPRRVFLVDGKTVVFQSQSIYPPTGELLRSQLELPAEAIGWLVESIETRFWEKPSEGGLPRDVLHDKAVIDGEPIKINRGVNIGGEGIGGFRIVNLDRQEYDKWKDLQEFSFTDIELVDMGLLDFFKDFAQRYASGQV